MLQENYTQNRQLESDECSIAAEADNSRSNFDIETELDHLKELILNSSRIPLINLTTIDEDLLLERLQQIQENLPIELATAVEIINRRQEIVADARSYAIAIVKSAQEKAHQIVKESAIVRQAELDGAKIRLQTEQECERLKQNAIAQSQAIQSDANDYVDGVLEDLEKKLQQMLVVVQNGRQQLD